MSLIIQSMSVTANYFSPPIAAWRRSHREPSYFSLPDVAQGQPRLSARHEQSQSWPPLSPVPPICSLLVRMPQALIRFLSGMLCWDESLYLPFMVIVETNAYAVGIVSVVWIFYFGVKFIVLDFGLCLMPVRTTQVFFLFYRYKHDFWVSHAFGIGYVKLLTEAPKLIKRAFTMPAIFVIPYFQLFQAKARSTHEEGDIRWGMRFYPFCKRCIFMEVRGSKYPVDTAAYIHKYSRFRHKHTY